MDVTALRRFTSLSSLVLGMLGSLYLSTELFGRRQGFLRRLSVALVLAFMSGLAMGIPLVYLLLVGPDPGGAWPLLLAIYAAAIGLTGVANFRFGDHMSSPDELSTAGGRPTLVWFSARGWSTSSMSRPADTSCHGVCRPPRWSSFSPLFCWPASSSSDSPC